MNSKPQSNKLIWSAIKNIKQNKPLFFVHIPKCGGTYINNIIKKTNINSSKKSGFNTHKPATEEVNRDHIVFAVIREPVSRYQSLINYRIRTDRIGNFSKDIKDCDNINAYIEKQADDTLTSFSPYNTLLHYSKNVDIFITIEELKDFLEFFGYNISKIQHKAVNTSTRKYGRFNNKTINRIARLFEKDIEFYQEKTS